ncbi:MAG: phosphate acetyltransferase [Mycoplasmataceae bacterium]|nr:phosphate acetyltransferase [Mycoplasmataceae bacterium]
MSLFTELKEVINNSNQKVKIVYPEGWHPFVLQAATEIVKSKIKITPILIFRTPNEVPNDLDKDVIKVVISEMDLNKYITYIYETRKHKGISLEDAQKLASQPNFLGSAMVALGEADGEICGIEYPTADTLKAALQIVKPANGVKTVCSGFVMEKGEHRCIFGDASVNINPDSDELVSITKSLSSLARNIAKITTPRIAMLSYSTAGSGKGASVDKVRNAYNLIKMDEAFLKENKIFGEIQFDAAFDLDVMKKKAKTLEWQEPANVFVFPNIDAGNIGYKIAQRMGGYQAIGPIILGLSHPVNDLSRGASCQDIIDLTYITAVQYLTKNK